MDWRGPASLCCSLLLSPHSVADAAPCPDVDLDGWADCAIAGCDPQGLLCGDCDDGAGSVYPGALETCDHRDDDCDTLVDEGFAQLTTSHTVHDTTWLGNFLGRALAVLGDVDGDGVADLAVGYPGDHTNGSWTGSVAILSGADRSIHCRAFNDSTAIAVELGNQVVALGDVDGDGVSDLAAAAWHSDVRAYDAGEVVIFSGADCGVIRHCVDPAGASQDQLGEENAIAALDDITGDGIAEIVAGAARANVDGLTDAGKALVFSGADCSVIYTLLDPSRAAYDFFGLAVAGLDDVTGDGVADVAVGEHYGDDATADGGAVLIFSGSTGAFVRRLLDPSSVASDWLGWSVARVDDLDGDGTDDLVAGARLGDTPAGVDRGEVVAFSGDDGVFLWRAHDPAGLFRDYLGWTVAAVPDVDGDGIGDVLAGAPYADRGVVANAGKALLFSGADGSYLRTLDHPEPRADDLLGFAVAGPGDLNGDGAPDFVVGVANDDVPKHAADRGAVLFVYPESDCDGDGQGPTGDDCDDVNPAVHAGAFEDCDGKDNDCDVAIDEDEDGDGFDACAELAVCAPSDLPTLDPRIHPGAAERCNGLDDDCDGEIDEGSDADADTWMAPCDCDDADPAVHPGATESCNHVADACGAVDEGFVRAAGRETYLDRYPAAADRFGNSVVGIGDVDGDGIADFGIGAPSDDLNGWDTGTVTAYSGADRRVLWRTPSSESFLNLGEALAVAGDLDGDGIGDLASGSSGNRLVLISGASGQEIGRCVDPAGGGVGADHGVAGWVDVTGDGVPEILAGAATNNERNHHQGKGIVFSYHRDDGTCSILRALWDPDGAVYDNLGVAIAGLGDLTGDGFPDIAVGEPGDDSLLDGNGAVLIFSGADGAFVTRLLDPLASTRDYLGQSVAALDDLDGDGWPEIAAGVEYRTVGGRSAAGEIVIFSGFDGAVLRRLSDPDAVAGDRLGWSIAATRDVDGDGLGDLVAGARYADVGGVVDAGQAMLFSTGTGAKLATIRNLGDSTSDHFGWSVASLGDLSGDGVPEVLVGAPYDDVAGPADSGSALLFGLDTDCDGDGLTPFGGDCDDTDLDLWRLPSEARDLRIAPDRITISWSAPNAPGTGSGALVYDTLRAGDPAGFDEGSCLETDGDDLETLDETTPGAGELLFYLVRAANACGEGDLGAWGEENWPREARLCP